MRRVDRRAVGEDGEGARASVGVHGDPEDPIVARVRDIEVAACRIEGQTIRTKARETVRPQELVLDPQGGRAGRGVHGVDGASEGIGHIQSAVRIALERVRVREAARDHSDRTRRDVDSIDARAAEVAVVIGDVDLTVREELTEERVARGDGDHSRDRTVAIDDADVAREPGSVERAGGVGGDALRVMAVARREIGEVLYHALLESCREHRLCGQQHENGRQRDQPTTHLILPGTR